MSSLNISDTQVTRDLGKSMVRGAMFRCPACGERSLFSAYLKIADSCSHCREELHHHQADDAPPYFTIFIVGHILIPLVLVVEQLWSPPLLIQTPMWLVLALAMTLTLLPMVKGAIVGLQWALFMHGFEHAARVREDRSALIADGSSAPIPR